MALNVNSTEDWVWVWLDNKWYLKDLHTGELLCAIEQYTPGSSIWLTPSGRLFHMEQNAKQAAINEYRNKIAIQD